MKKIIITEEQANRLLVQEYFDRETSALWKYFNKSDEEKDEELIRQNFSRFYSYINYEISEEEFNQYFSNDKDTEIEQMCDNQDVGLAEEIINGSLQYFKRDFANYLIQELFDLPQYAPSWLTLTNPQKVTNEWLIHFSDESFWIAQDGFKHMKPNIESLAYTRWLKTQYNGLDDGYCFAYDCKDFENYYKTVGGKLKYGNEAVIFRASGVKLWHRGDKEYQVIFYGSDAKDFIYIEENDGQWCIKSTQHGSVLYTSDSIQNIVKWATNNYDQYNKHTVSYSGRKNHDASRYYKQHQSNKG